MKLKTKVNGWTVIETRWTTRGADPTEVVDWTLTRAGAPALRVREFFGEYSVIVGSGRSFAWIGKEASVDRILRRFGGPDLRSVWDAVEDERYEMARAMEMYDWTEADRLDCESERYDNLKNEY